MDEPAKLLTDLQMRQFVSDGWLALPVTEMPDLHAELHASAQKMWQMNGEANGGSVTTTSTRRSRSYRPSSTGPPSTAR